MMIMMMMVTMTTTTTTMMMQIFVAPPKSTLKQHRKTPWKWTKTINYTGFVCIFLRACVRACMTPSTLMELYKSLQNNYSIDTALNHIHKTIQSAHAYTVAHRNTCLLQNPKDIPNSTPANKCTERNTHTNAHTCARTHTHTHPTHTHTHTNPTHTHTHTHTHIIIPPAHIYATNHLQPQTAPLPINL